MRDTIVLLDDEPNVVNIIRLIKIVLNIGQDQTHEDEDASLKRLATMISMDCKPDVIKLDLKIPGLDSNEIMERVKKDPVLSSIGKSIR